MSKHHSYDLCPVLQSASRKAWRDLRRVHDEGDILGEGSLTATIRTQKHHFDVAECRGLFLRVYGDQFGK